MLSKTARCFLAALLSAAWSASFAFTVQLPVSGYTFVAPLNIYDFEVGDLDLVYTVPEGQIAVITDIYITPTTNSDSSTYSVFLFESDSPPGTSIVGGPYRLSTEAPFSQSLTSGIVFTSGQSIGLSSTGGTGDVTVNLGGYLVCVDPC
jgi:hypothetical protein